MSDEDRASARDLSLRGVRPPAAVPGYEQEEFLGHGAYGEVWVAVNRNSGRKVAIKFYTHRGGVDWSSLAREVEKMRYLFSDRYVVQLFEVGWESDPPYYVMEFMENGSLEDLLRPATLPVQDAVSYFREIAFALVHAHNKGILHCDLKPANVLLDQDRRPRLADFGQSRLTNEMSPALGTLFYMAPEQADLVAAPDARWDVYALGAVMYRMLTGKPPHYQAEPPKGNLEHQLTAYRKMILSSPRPDAHRAVPGVDPGLAAIIDRCLETSPGKRFANAQAVVSAIDAWKLKRVRRPLLFLIAFCFTLLFLIVASIGAYLFMTSVNTAKTEVIARALESNRFAAHSEAGQLALQIQFRWAQLEAAARDPVIREMVQKGLKLRDDPHSLQLLDQALATRKQRSDRQLDETFRSSIWFVDDAAGLQVACVPCDPGHLFKYRGYRDYFTGLGYEEQDKQGPPKRILHKPHRSAVFHRNLDSGEEFWSIALSVPIWKDPAAKSHDGHPIGVVGLALDLKGHSVVSGNHERFVVLIDTHADLHGKRGLVLRHPVLEHLPAGSEQQLFYAKNVVDWADAGPDETLNEEDYHDPVGGQYAGRWLAALERVQVRPDDGKPEDSGLVVVVQERASEVLGPVRDLQWRLACGAGGAAFIVIVLMVSLSAGISSVLEGAPRSRVTRFLHRWAGVPSTATSKSTATSGESVTGGKTARGNSALSTPGTAPHTPVAAPAPASGDATPR
jgi:hypothetical protein